ncbi:hypothetical protein HDV05_002934 [Chytridiales sp. JEL 0842]|nr:hypothetical protein HDV05_002934 [Chytridiales sp. JEL 0842]
MPLFSTLSTCLQSIGLPNPSTFSFENAPLSTFREAASVCFLYVLLTLLFSPSSPHILHDLHDPQNKLAPANKQHHVPNKQVTSKQKSLISRKFIKRVFWIHNAFLSVASFVLLLLFIEQLGPMLSKMGLHASICSPEAFTKELEFLYYVNYLFKFYELFDTLLLILLKKRPIFLHWYHHSMTLFLCFIELQGRASVSWIPITLNLAVHTWMYYYYALTTFMKPSKPKWKIWLTVFQITQFVLDMIFISYATFWSLQTVHKEDGGLLAGEKQQQVCSGTREAAGWGCLILGSYLGLFLRFFVATYFKKKGGKVE